MTASTGHSLAHVETVVLVFHGIGDHDPINILDEAKQGLSQSFSAGEPLTFREIEVDLGRVDLHRLSSLNARPFPAAAFALNDGEHVILPVVWSGVRNRAVGLQKPGVGAGLPLFSTALAFEALFHISKDAVRCVPYARGASWKAAIALAVAVVVGLVAALIPAVSFLSTEVFFALGAGKAWYSVMGFALVLWLVDRLVIRHTLSVLDLLGDVAAYVGNRRRRADLRKTASQIITTIATLAPKARIVIVAHSLGSVLLTQTLCELSDDVGPGRLILVTLGSPLRLLARIFPDVVQPAPTIANRLATAGQLAAWANLWRSADVIGQSLAATRPGFYTERSLGSGPHWGYWEDARLWRRIAWFVWASQHRELDNLVKLWNSTELDDYERQELIVDTQSLRSAFWSYMATPVLVLPFTGFCLLYTLPRLSLVGPGTVSIARWIWIAFFLGFAAMLVTAFLSLRAAGSDHARLSRLRRWKPVYEGLWSGWVTLAKPFTIVMAFSLAAYIAGVLK